MTTAGGNIIGASHIWLHIPSIAGRNPETGIRILIGRTANALVRKSTRVSPSCSLTKSVDNFSSRSIILVLYSFLLLDDHS